MEEKNTRFHITHSEGSNTTHELLRFNMLSRKAAILTSKGAKGQIATEYLTAEFERIENHLDTLLKESNGQSASNISEDARQVSTDMSNQEIVRLGDPTRIQQKGRPKNPTRLIPMVEKLRAKTAKAEAKKVKNKKTQQSSKIFCFELPE